MLDPNLIKNLNKSCRVYFHESDFRFHLKSSFYIVSTGTVCSSAYNWKKGEHSSVQVVKWFDDFWVFSDGSFHNGSVQLSLSIFQGKSEDDKKSQLIRAEWDQYSSNNGPHPQPHWHVTSNVAFENTFEDFANTFGEDDFLAVLASEKAKTIDIGKFHFPMCANWLHSDKNPIYIDGQKIVDWYIGLFSEIRPQLIHCKV